MMNFNLILFFFLLMSCVKQGADVNLYSDLINKNSNYDIEDRKIEIYLIDQDIYLINYFYQKKWDSELILCCHGKCRLIPYENNYIENIFIKKHKFQKNIYHIYVLNSSHRGNGSCVFYEFDVLNQRIAKKLEFDGAIISDGLMNYKVSRIEETYLDFDLSVLVLSGYKQIGLRSISHEDHYHVEQDRVNNIERIYDKSEYLRGLLSCFLMSDKSLEAYKSFEVLNNLVEDLSDDEISIINTYDASSIRLDLVKSILRRKNKKVNGTDLPVLDILMNKKVSHFHFLFYLLSNLEPMVLSADESLFISNYTKYLKGQIVDIKDVFP